MLECCISLPGLPQLSTTGSLHNAAAQTTESHLLTVPKMEVQDQGVIRAGFILRPLSEAHRLHSPSSSQGSFSFLIGTPAISDQSSPESPDLTSVTSLKALSPKTSTF